MKPFLTVICGREGEDLQPNSIENALHIQIHHLRKRAVGVRIEFLPPRRSCVGKQYIYMVGRLGHFPHESLDVSDLGAVGGDGDGAGAWADVGEGVESGAGGVAGGGFAGGDVDFGAACLHEPEEGEFCQFARSNDDIRWERAYAEAAWSPRPREPPVTTATLPSREKREGKSLRSVWALASAAALDMVDRRWQGLLGDE